eukprot:1107897_1
MPREGKRTLEQVDANSYVKVPHPPPKRIKTNYRSENSGKSQKDGDVKMNDNYDIKTIGQNSTKDDMYNQNSEHKSCSPSPSLSSNRDPSVEPISHQQPSSRAQPVESSPNVYHHHHNQHARDRHSRSTARDNGLHMRPSYHRQQANGAYMGNLHQTNEQKAFKMDFFSSFYNYSFCEMLVLSGSTVLLFWPIPIAYLFRLWMMSYRDDFFLIVNRYQRVNQWQIDETMRRLDYYLFWGTVIAMVSSFVPFVYFRFHFFANKCDQLKLLEQRHSLKCKVPFGFGTYCIEFVIPCILKSIATFGIYFWFGFAYQDECAFYDTNMEWYSDGQEIKAEIMLFRTYVWSFTDCIVWFAACCGTIGMCCPFLPCYSFYVFKKNCHRIKIGKYRCKVMRESWGDCFCMTLKGMILNWLTLNWYSVLGFYTQNINVFYDTHVEWYLIE